VRATEAYWDEAQNRQKKERNSTTIHVRVARTALLGWSVNLSVKPMAMMSKAKFVVRYLSSFLSGRRARRALMSGVRLGGLSRVTDLHRKYDCDPKKAREQSCGWFPWGIRGDAQNQS
jgi:hypothetical protein